MSADQQADGVNASRTLSDDDVRQIGGIVEALEQSPFDFLQLEFGDLKLTIGKGQLSLAAIETAPAAPAAPAHDPVHSGASPAPARASTAAEEPADDDAIAVLAPLLGRFYAQPEPGAPPFVVVGSEVNADTTVGLVEVMKTFNAVPAGVTGSVTEICVEDAGFVEYGQVLLRVRPAHG